MPDVGKDGKRKGDLHPRDARRIDTAPLRATPAAKPHRKAPKLFGYAYEEQLPKRALRMELATYGAMVCDRAPERSSLRCGGSQVAKFDF